MKICNEKALPIFIHILFFNSSSISLNLCQSLCDLISSYFKFVTILKQSEVILININTQYVKFLINVIIIYK